MSKRAEEFACKYAGYDAPPTRRDELENREKCDIFGACLDAYEQAEKDIKDYLLGLIEEEEKFWDDGEMIFRRLKKELNEL